MRNQNYDKARVRNLMQAETAARTAFAHGYDMPDASVKKSIEMPKLLPLFARLLNLRSLRSALTSL